MSDEDAFLAHEELSAADFKGLEQLENAVFEFEPLAKRGKLGPVTADRLVSMGLAEKGPVSAADASRGYSDGYRLTDLGWKVKERGRFPKRRR